MSGAVLAGLGLCGAPAAWAGVSIFVSPSVPEVVQVGQTVAASLSITNTNTAPNAGLSDTLGTITYVPSCASQVISSNCSAPFQNPGVLVPRSPGIGAIGSACADVTFSISLLDLAQGKYSVAPQTPVNLAPPGSGPTSTCAIQFGLDVVKLPIDANEVAAGDQTDQLAFADATAPGGLFAANIGTDETRVAKGAPGLTTQVSAAQIAPGATFTDTATLAVADFATDPTGTVTFNVFDNASCGGTPVLTSTNGVNAQGTGAVSGVFAPPAVGTYRVVATYGGDANYEAAATGCGDPTEVVTVAVVPPPQPPPPPPPTPPAVTRISSIASASITLGGQIRDTATILGRANPTGTDTVEFRLYGPDDEFCLRTPAFLTTVALDATGIASSARFTPTRTGQYRWRALYSGDANNLAVASLCNAPNENVSVYTPDGPRIVSAAFESPPQVGRTTLLTVNAVDPQQPVSGVQVRFGEARGLTGVSACRVTSLGRSVSPVRLQIPYVFRTAGAHNVVIDVLSGDCTGALRRFRTTIGVDVVAGSTARHTLRAARGATIARAAATASSCKDRFLSPSSPAARVRVATAVLCLVNVERSKRGRKKLLRSPRLQLAAKAHSSDMIRRRYFEHERVPGGPKLVSRLTKVGYRGGTYAENIGYGSGYNATLMVAAWMNSPGHRANILHPRLRFAGVGLTSAIPVAPQRPGSTYTMDFGATLR